MKMFPKNTQRNQAMRSLQKIEYGGKNLFFGGQKHWRQRGRRCVCVCVCRCAAAAISPLLSLRRVQRLIDSFYSYSVRLGQLKGVTTHGCAQ